MGNIHLNIYYFFHITKFSENEFPYQNLLPNHISSPTTSNHVHALSFYPLDTHIHSPQSSAPSFVQIHPSQLHLITPTQMSQTQLLVVLNHTLLALKRHHHLKTHLTPNHLISPNPSSHIPLPHSTKWSVVQSYVYLNQKFLMWNCHY